jgi:hypothetical protein
MTAKNETAKVNNISNAYVAMIISRLLQPPNRSLIPRAIPPERHNGLVLEISQLRFDYARPFLFQGGGGIRVTSVTAKKSLSMFRVLLCQEYFYYEM